MKKIGSYEAKTQRKTNPRLVIEELRIFRKGHTLGGISLRELIEEGRRF